MALQFDGANDSVSHGNLAWNGIANLTVTMWIRVDTHGASETVFSRQSSNAGFWARMAGDASNSTHDLVFNTGIIASPDTVGRPAVGVFHHDAMVYDGGGSVNADRYKQYWNGLITTPTFTGTVPTTLASAATASFFIGRGTANFTAITVFNLKIWLASLTADEIHKEAFSYRPVRVKDLYIWSPYDDGTTAADLSGNALHGTIADAPTQTNTKPDPVSYGDVCLAPLRNTRRILHNYGNYTRRGRYISYPSGSLIVNPREF